eukprot:492526-Prorocentrum_minimum.AAC.2
MGAGSAARPPWRSRQYHRRKPQPRTRLVGAIIGVVQHVPPAAPHSELPGGTPLYNLYDL